MLRRALAAVGRTFRGIAVAARARPWILLGSAAAVSAFNLAVPVLVLSIARRPPDFLTVNPWLKRLPEYLGSGEPLANKVDFLTHMALGWVSADNGGEGIDWGFIVDVPTLAQIAVTSLVFGAYFALWSYRRREGMACGVGFKAARPAGVAGAVTSVLGLTTGPCTLAGCGVPVLPIVGLAFTGLESSTLSLFTTLSRISMVVVLTAMAAAVAWFGWRVGGAAQTA